jgi:hypothetical protein
MGRKRHNPERRAWRGRSYKKGGERIRDMKKEFDLKITSDGTIETIYQEGLEKFAVGIGGEVVQVCRASNVEFETIGRRKGWSVRSVSRPDLALRRIHGEIVPGLVGIVVLFPNRKEALAAEVRFFWELKGKRNGKGS